MTMKINPSISYEQTTGSGNVYYQTKSEITNAPLKKVVDDKTTESVLSKKYYQLKLPANVNVVEKAMQSLSSITNLSVREQTSKLLMLIYNTLQEVVDVSKVSNRLSTLHLTERDDQSALLEWNYESFRIGFSLEPKEEDSNYYIVSENKEVGSFCAETYRLGENYKEAINVLANYVIRNT